MKKFEYSKEYLSNKFDEWVSFFDKKGQEGWELVQIYGLNPHSVAYFKREII